MSDLICMECKYVGRPRLIKRGSVKLEVLGWLMFPFGLPYTIWRMFGRTRVCRNCGGSMLVAVGSPTGKRLLDIVEKELTGEKYSPPSPPDSSADSMADFLPVPPEEKPAEPSIITERIKPVQDPNAW